MPQPVSDQLQSPLAGAGSNNLVCIQNNIFLEKALRGDNYEAYLVDLYHSQQKNSIKICSGTGNVVKDSTMELYFKSSLSYQIICVRKSKLYV